MYYKLTFLVLVLFIASCKKEESPEPTPAVQYDIYVNDWIPDIVITGSLSNSSLDLDFNGDGQTDFEFEVHRGSNWYDSLGYDVYHVWNYHAMDNYLLDTTFKVAMFNDTINNTLFVIGETINETARWGSSPILYGKRWWDHSNSNSNVEYYYNPYGVNNGDGYLALKREVNGDVYYGWIHVNVQPDQVTFFESGFNQIPNVPIQIGQMQ